MASSSSTCLTSCAKFLHTVEAEKQKAIQKQLEQFDENGEKKNGEDIDAVSRKRLKTEENGSQRKATKRRRRGYYSGEDYDLVFEDEDCRVFISDMYAALNSDFLKRENIEVVVNTMGVEEVDEENQLYGARYHWNYNKEQELKGSWSNWRNTDWTWSKEGGWTKSVAKSKKTAKTEGPADDNEKEGPAGENENDIQNENSEDFDFERNISQNPAMIEAEEIYFGVSNKPGEGETVSGSGPEKFYGKNVLYISEPSADNEIYTINQLFPRVNRKIRHFLERKKATATSTAGKKNDEKNDKSDTTTTVDDNNNSSSKPPPHTSTNSKTSILFHCYGGRNRSASAACGFWWERNFMKWKHERDERVQHGFFASSSRGTGAVSDTDDLSHLPPDEFEYGYPTMEEVILQLVRARPRCLTKKGGNHTHFISILRAWAHGVEYGVQEILKEQLR